MALADFIDGALTGKRGRHEAKAGRPRVRPAAVAGGLEPLLLAHTPLRYPVSLCFFFIFEPALLEYGFVIPQLFVKASCVKTCSP